jgi:hypothetical protein
VQQYEARSSDVRNENVHVTCNICGMYGLGALAGIFKHPNGIADDKTFETLFSSEC